MRPSLTRLTHPRTRATPPRRQHRLPTRTAPEPPTVEMPIAELRGPELRSREAGGPQDSACYECSCGYVFSASVSTSVSCPQCAQGQAW
jgi:hypothetical protein